MRVDEGESGEDLNSGGGGRRGYDSGWWGGGVDSTTVEAARHRGGGMNPTTVEAVRRQGARGGGVGSRREPDGNQGGSWW
jgi:hypothetical protein